MVCQESDFTGEQIQVKSADNKQSQREQEGTEHPVFLYKEHGCAKADDYASGDGFDCVEAILFCVIHRFTSFLF